jgi:gliding motility-associated-like protein
MKTLIVTIMLVLCTGGYELCAQTYVPVAVTGFNNDVVAESGGNAAALTTTVLDLSNYIIYSAAFAAANGLSGGLPDNGAIVNGARTYQLQPYNVNNALFLSANGAVANTVAAGTLTLAAPANYSRLSLLLFSTEGATTLSITLHFTDGTTAAGGNVTVADWFGGANPVYAGYGRIARATAPPYLVDGVTSNNPRFYRYDMGIACANQSRLLQSVSITYVSGSGSLFPTRGVVMAVSGVPYTPLTVTPVINHAVCGGNSGSIALTVSGGTAPLSYNWNTAPVQTQPLANNLPGGDYTCTIIDAGGCTTVYQGTVLRQSAATLSITATDTLLCNGTPATLTASASGGAVSNYTWLPGNVVGASLQVTPAATTQYVLSAQDAFGCLLKDSVEIRVKPVPVADFTVTPATACLGMPQTLSFTGTAGVAATYDWNNFAGAGVQSGNGAGPYTIVFNREGTYPLELQVTDEGCVSDIVMHLANVTAPPLVNFDVSDIAPCAGESTTVTFTGNAGNNATAAWSWGGGLVRQGSGWGPFTVQYQSSGAITLTVTDGACTVTTLPRQVNVIPVPVAAFTPGLITGCPDLPVTFNNGSQHADTWLWRFGDGDHAAAASPTHTYTTPGIYTVTLIAGAQQQCFDTLVQAALVNVWPSPVAAFAVAPGLNTPLELSDARFSFSNRSQHAVAYAWDFGDNTRSGLKDPQHQYDMPGAYRVSLAVRNDIGCTDSTSQAWLIVEPDKVLQVPNAFSPNNDGVNDRWELTGLRGIPGCQVEIFNRWGQQVYESIGYEKPWDGTWKRKQLPAGTYYYVIRARVKDRPYTGWVALLR